MKELLSFVIPCYRSEKTITSVIDEIIDKCDEKSELFDYEIVLINDCSPDNVWSVIKELTEKNKRIKAAAFARNFGQHAALMAGYKRCSGDIIITLDDDGQSPIDAIYDLVDAIHEGYDVVYGKYVQKKSSFFRVWGSSVNKKMSEMLLGKPKDITTNSFFGMKRFVAEEMVRYENSYPYIEGLIMRTTRNIKNVTVMQRERQIGRSGYTLGKLISLWVNGFTAFSVKPLRIATIAGCICAFVGFIVGLILVIQKLLNPDIAAGYTSLISVMLLIGGLQMLMLGLVGEYIGRIYISINNSPQYVIKEEINLEQNEKQKVVS